jgi:hypothetical protein
MGNGTMENLLCRSASRIRLRPLDLRLAGFLKLFSAEHSLGSCNLFPTLVLGGLIRSMEILLALDTDLLVGMRVLAFCARAI